MAKIFIGPAGTGGAELENFKKLKQAGVDGVELEFTYGIWLTKEQAEKIKELNKTLGLRLSIHAPYFINLNSEDAKKVGASRSRILKSLEVAKYVGANFVVFHPGFYLKSSKEDTYNKIKEQLGKLKKEAQEKNLDFHILAPETTGKATAFGDLDETLKLSKELGCSICVDFAHLKARYNGNIDYPSIIKKLKDSGLKKIHAHFSGIEYTSKGERKHLITQEKDIKELFSYLNELNMEISIINESPQPLEDAIKMKKLLGGM